MWQWLRRGFHWNLQHPWVAILAGILLTAAAHWGVRHLAIQVNFVDLLPPDQPSVIELHQLERVVGGASYVVVTIEPRTPELAPPFLEALAARLAHHPQIRFLDYRPPTEFLRRSALLHLPLPRLEEFATGIERRLDQLKLKELYIDFAEEAVAPISLEQIEADYPFFREHEYYRNRDGTLFVMLIKPTGRSTDTAFTKSLLADINAAIAAVRDTLGDGAGGATDIGVRLTGPYVKALAQIERVKQDAGFVSLLSLGGILLIIWIYFRRFRVMLLVGLPMALGVYWTLGLAYLCFGSLNFFTAICCAVLMGLSADYGIHVFSHYLEARGRGLHTEAALLHTFEELFWPMTLAAVTTMAAFFALAISNFKPLYQFGVIAGLGIPCTLVAIALLLPPLIQWFAGGEKMVCRSDLLPHTMALLMPIFRAVQERRGFRLMSLLIVALLVPLAFGLPRFDFNLANIMGEQETKRLDARVDKIFSYSVNPEVARAATPEDAVAFARAMRETRDRLRGSGQDATIQTAIALGDFVPPDQPAKIARIARLRRAFTDAVLQGMTPDERQAYDRLQPALTPTPIRPADLPEALRAKFRDLEGQEGRFLYIFPDFDRQNGHQVLQFARELQTTVCQDCAAPVVVSGESIIFSEIVARILADEEWIVFASLAAVLLSLQLVFRRRRHTIACAGALGLMLLTVLGIMRLLHIPFTLVNIAAFPVLLGTGIDYAIYLYQQSLQQGAHGLERAYRLSGPPILASAVTTVWGYGALLFAENGGVSSFGTISALGIAAAALIVLCWFPGFIAWQQRRDRGNAATAAETTEEITTRLRAMPSG